MSEQEPGFPLKWQSFEKFDGSMWRQFESPNSLILLTSSGQELFKNEPGLAPLIHEYVADYEKGQEEQDNTRRFLAEGGNARVFSLGDKELVIKEAKHDSEDGGLLPSMDRMDRLINAVENHCPRWIDVPQHYGVLISKKDPKRQFLLMEKIDEGVAACDIVQYPPNPNKNPRGPRIQESLEESFGPITPELQHDIKHRYNKMLGFLRKALMSEYLDPDEYLRDLDRGYCNVVLEQASAPVAGSKVKYWVIDQ